MFHADANDLVIGENIWVINFDINVQSIEEIGIPKQMTYTDCYIETGGDRMLIFFDLQSNKYLSVAANYDLGILHTGFVIIRKRRKDILDRITAMSNYNEESVKFISNCYLKFIKKEYPELII